MESIRDRAAPFDPFDLFDPFDPFDSQKCPKNISKTVLCCATPLS